MKKQKISLLLPVVGAIMLVILAVVVLVLASPEDTTPVILPTVEDNAPADSAAEDADVLTVTNENVQAVIATLARAGSYSREIISETFWAGGSAETVFSVWAHGESLRVEARQGDRTRNMILTADDCWIWYGDAADNVYHGTGENDIRDMDEWLGLPTYEDVLEIPAGEIRDSGYSEYAGDTCIYVVYSSGEMNYRNHIYVSVTTGLVMGMEIYDGQNLIYRMESTMPELSTPADELFLPPEAAG